MSMIGISASLQTWALATVPSLTHSLFLSSPSPSPAPQIAVFFLLFIILITNYSHQMPPQAQPVPTSPPKLCGRHKLQPSNPDDMNKCLWPNNSDPKSNDGEHIARSTTTWKKAQKRGKKTQCIAHLFFFFLYWFLFYLQEKQPRMLI